MLVYHGPDYEFRSSAMSRVSAHDRDVDIDLRQLLVAVWQKRLKILAAVVGVTILAIFALSLFFYLRRIARVYSTWQRLSPETKTLRFRVSETGIACLTENSQERVEWSKLFRLWIYADVWILEILKMQSMVFPPSAALESTRDQIVEHCRSAGRPVIRGRRFFP